MYCIYSFVIFILLAPILANPYRSKRQLDVSYGSPSYKYCECGRKNQNIPQNSRIVGGNETLENEYPWMAAIVAIEEKIPRLLCGGSVINDLYILTAAHCLSAKYTQIQMKVMLGQHNFCSPSAHSITFSIEKFVQHPDYISTKHLLADIMLVKLDMKVTFNPYIRPICLPERVGNHRIKTYAGLVGDIVGWGIGGDSNDFCILRKTSVIIYKECRYRSFYLFCAGHPQGEHDSCVGDSGGPFQVLNIDGKFELIGIISSGIACGDAEAPGLYTDVPYVLSWIYEATQDSMFCWK